MRPPQFKGNVIIWNLPDQFSGADLAAMFDDYGLVLGASVKHWPNEPERNPRGLVDLAPDAAVERAIAALDGSIVGTQKIKVRRAHEAPRQNASGSAERPDRRNAGTRPAARQAETQRRPAAGKARQGFVVEHKVPPRRVIVPRPQ